MDRNLLKSQKGASLVGTLVAVAILGIVAAGTLQVIDQQLKGERSQKVKNEIENFHGEIRAALSDETACVATLGGLIPNGVDRNITQITDKSNRTMVDINNQRAGMYDSGLIEITSMRFHNFVSDDSGNPNHRMGKMQLDITYEPIGSIVGLDRYIETIAFKVRRNAGNVLDNCLSYAKMAEGIWRQAPDDADSAFFSGGNIGINTNDPQFRLDIAGAVRIGSDSPANGCAAATAGLMRYDTGTNQMQYCNGTEWLGVGHPSGAVMAFDRSSCPDGWTRLAVPAGRVLVTSGGGAYAPGASGGSRNSTVSFTISRNNMPAHTHPVNPPNTYSNTTGNHNHSYRGGSGTTRLWAQSSQPNCGYSGTSLANLLCSRYQQFRIPSSTSGRTGNSGNHRHTTNIPNFNSGTSGSGTPISRTISVEQPYRAILYCRKD